MIKIFTRMAMTRYTRFLFAALITMVSATGCFHYSFNQGAIPKQVKTIRINYIENKARYINPQLSPQLTDRLRQKINSQSGKTITQNDNADYDISGTVTDYSFTTAAISGNRTATNRLNVTVHISFKNRLDPSGKSVSPADFEADVSRSFDFDANISIQQAESQLNESIMKNLSDEIFNRIFSNW
jgi:hypothetical protein